MMHQMAHWNWGGLLFVTLWLPATGLVTVGLRRWAEKNEAARPPHAPLSLREKVQMLRLAIGWKKRNTRPLRPAPMVRWNYAFRNSVTGATSPAMPANAIASSNYRPEPHEHVFDYARSPLRDNGNGSTVVCCAVQGCTAFVVAPDPIGVRV